MTATTGIPHSRVGRPIRHGTIQGYRNDGCRQDCCRAARRDHQRQLQAPKIAARRAQLAADHAATGNRPASCKCDTCTNDRAHKPRPTPTRRPSSRRAATIRPEGPWAFIRYAAHPADLDVPDSVQPKSVVCCETEVLEPEGAGHDWWCPTTTKETT